MDQAEIKKKKREEARNTLEAYLYKARDQLSASWFSEASTQSERDQLSALLESTSEWIWDAAETATTVDLKAKRTDLEWAVNYRIRNELMLCLFRKLAKPIISRFEESRDRPAARSSFQAVLAKAEQFVLGARANATQDEADSQMRRHTNEELDGLAASIKSALEWFTQADKKQSVLAANLDPVLKNAELEKRAVDVQTEVDRLAKKKRPRKPKPTTSSSSASPSETSTASASSESAKSRDAKDEL